MTAHYSHSTELMSLHQGSLAVCSAACMASARHAGTCSSARACRSPVCGVGSFKCWLNELRIRRDPADGRAAPDLPPQRSRIAERAEDGQTLCVAAYPAGVVFMARTSSSVPCSSTPRDSAVSFASSYRRFAVHGTQVFILSMQFALFILRPGPTQIL